MSKKANITVIPATVPMFTQVTYSPVNKRRTAAYARVSTDSEEQETSFTAQVDYYTKYIAERPDWQMVEVYTDEGISAVNTKRRDGFKRMIADALAGKIDLIVTKSVSRFARNTVDSLQTIRKLKEKSVECYFEKENIWTFDGKGELLITIMSSLAQEESRSISQNVTWGQRKRFADGKVSMPYKQFLGYERGKDGTPKIVESEAKIVRQIYQQYLNGTTVRDICRTLTASEIPTPSGKKERAVSTVISILQNEKYAGNALLQKTFCEDFLTKKMVKNEGQVPQYFVTESHPAIISQEMFDLVQAEIAKNRILGKNRSGCSPFADMITCGTCGHTYGRKVWNSKSQYRRVVWQCNGKYKERGTLACETPHLTEEQIQDAFMRAFNLILGNKEPYISALEPALALISDTSALDNESEVLQERYAGLFTQLEELVTAQAHRSGDFTEYQARYTELNTRYESVKHRLAEIEQERQDKRVKREKVLAFTEVLRGKDTLLSEFDEHFWRATVEIIIVNSEKDIVVRFRDGRSVSVNLHSIR